MTFTSYRYLLSFVIRAIAILVIATSFLYSPLLADTVVSPATGGANLCVGGDYVTLGDIVVRENISTDFRSDLNKKFVLIINSTNFQFEPGVGKVSIISGSSTVLDPLTPITVTGTAITVNFATVGTDIDLDGFTISGIRIRAINAAGSARILRQSPAGITGVNFRKNQPIDRVNHGTLASSTSPAIVLASNDTDNTICAGETLSFVATSVTATYYEFFIDGISKQNGTSNTFATSLLTNGQIVSAKSTVKNGCTSASSNGIAVTVYSLPTLSISSNDTDNTICQGQTVMFSASPSDLTSYDFFINNTLVQSGNSHQYSTSALSNGQTIMVKATANKGCSVSSSGITTTVYTLPKVSLVSSDADNIICAGETVTFTASAAGATSHEFFINGITQQNSTLPTFTTDKLQNTDVVSVQSRNNYGCSATVFNSAFTVNTVPVVTLVSSDDNNSICIGQAVKFTATAAEATNFDFLVDGISVQNSSADVYITNSLTDGQTVQVIATNSNNCTAKSNKITTIVNNLPVVKLVSSDADNIICSGQTVTFSATADIGVIYHFFADGVSVQNSGSNTYTSSALTDGQKIEVEVISAEGCMASSASIVTTVQPTPSITLSSSDADNSICAGELVTFSASIIPSAKYEFFVNGVSIQSGSSHEFSTVVLKNGQAVNTVVTTSDNCQAVSNTIVNKVNDVPQVSLASSDADNIICAKEPVTFTASSSIPATYDFYVDDISVQTGASNSSTITGLTHGQKVMVKATTANGCTTKSESIITTVQSLPAKPVIIIVSGSSTFCEQNANSVTLQSSSPINNQWYKDGVLLPEETGQTITLSTIAQNGHYTVNTSDLAPTLCRSAASDPIAVTIYSVPDATLFVTNSTSVCADNPAAIFVEQTQTGINYELYEGSTLLAGPRGGTGGTIRFSSGILEVGNHTFTIKAINPATGCSTDLATTPTVIVNEKPTAILTSTDANNKICAGETVTFEATLIFQATYNFFINGNSVQNSSSPIFSTNSLTDGQTVSVLVSTIKGCATISEGITTTVYGLPIVTISSSDADNTVCEGETVEYTATSSTATNYEFFLNNVSVQNGGSNKLILTNNINSHSIKVLVTTASGCSATSSNITTTVNQSVSVEAGPDQTLCEGSVITMKASVSGPSTGVTWSGGLGSFSDIHSITTQYSPAGTEIGKTVILTITTNDPDGNGPCTAMSDRVSITIYPLPTVLMSGLNSQYCIDAPAANLTGFPLGGTFSGPGIIYNGTSYMFEASEAGIGTHTIWYTFQDNNTCTNYIQKTVTVYPLPTVSFSGFNGIGAGGTPLYPQNASLVSLRGNPAGGIFSGTGISGNTFSPSAAGPGSFTIRYTFQDANGCANFQEQTVTVVALPAIGISDIPSPFCSKDPDFILTGSPAGGVFSGPGIISSTSIFRPSSAFIGANVIRYTYTDQATGGIAFVEKTITVNKVPDVTFSGLNASYCSDVISVPLSGFPADADSPGGVSGVFKGAGIYSGSTQGTYYFNPSAAGSGMHTITYIYTNENGCTDSTSKSVIVHELPQVTFSGLDEGYCEDAFEAKLSGFPSTGTFSGPGISGNTFFSALAGVGTHNITYTYTNSNGCTNTQTRVVKVYAVPVANFGFFNVCDKDNVLFNDLTDPGLETTIESWEWDFGDMVSGSLNTSSAQNPTHQFTAPGNYLVTLKVTSRNGCENVKTLPVTIGGLPKPDFTWERICFGDGTLFTHQTNIESGTIISWEWDFGDSQKVTFTEGSKEVIHYYTSPGRYQVTLKVTTNYACLETLTKDIYILPGVSKYPYFENFEVSAGGWVEDGNHSSWEHGTPSGNTINIASSGQRVWMTGLNNSYNANEKSYVYSPCFDFSGLSKPMIALKIWTHTQQGFDGAVLQSSTDGGTTWENIGTVGEGINWYNQSAIIGNPGNQMIGQNGWSGTDTTWRDAKFALDYLTGKPSVRFRMAFGSNSDNPPNQILDGFAFDDVFIGERDRTVLLEHFTNSSNPEANQENLFIEGLSAGNDEVISIQYHTNFPGIDPMNTTNWADPSARALYYGVPQTPRTSIDGYIENQKFSAWGTPVLSRRKLKETAFAIGVDFPQTTDNRLNIITTITSHFDNTDTLIVHIAVVEKQVADLYDGSPVFTNVLRKMLPDAAGTRFTRVWNTGDAESIEQSWPVNNAKDASQLAVIVFIQNERTREVYQAVIKQPSSPPSLVTGLNNQFIDNHRVTVYPNPASGKALIMMDAPAAQTYSLVLYDLLGRKVEEGTIDKGQKETSIQVSALSEGTYLIHITGRNKTSIYKKLVVLHNN